MFSVRKQTGRQTCAMYTRDGVRLDADVYFPEDVSDGKGPFPVLLMRQPYGRAIASTIVYAHPQWYAAQGYIVVIQDVRGRGTSQGKFQLFAHEVEDGEDTLAWAAQLPGSDGHVGMYGFSYQGMTQLYAAQTRHSALKAIAPAMTGYHLYEDWAYENGALCLQLGLTWAVQLAAETARIEGDVTAYQKLLSASRRLPLADPIPACPQVLEGVDSFFHDWVAHSQPDEYWQKLTPQLDLVDLPMLHIGGWFDPYLRGDVRLYRQMAAKSNQPQPFWIGPWGHIPWGRRVGAVDFGPAAMSPVDQLQVEWFDHILKGKALPEEHRGLSCFEMGRNQWRRFAAWPEGAKAVYFLQSSGLANIREDSGKLIAELKASASVVSSYDNLVHDPWNPAPALGGHSAIPAGMFERTAIDSRGDVLTYTSEPLSEEMRVAGVVEVVCAIAAAAKSYDLCAVLSRVCTRQAEKQVYNLTQGYCRVDTACLSEPDGRAEAKNITLLLQPTCFSLQPGEALRLSLSAACFPAYPVNNGTGVAVSAARLIDAEIVTLAIATGEGAFELRLPLSNQPDD
ncbi:MAG: CocE/NonD family hydrolase [Phormidesmis sp.]